MPIRTMNFIGWKGHEGPLSAGGCLAANRLSLRPTHVSDDQTIVDRLAAGELVDVISPDLKFIPCLVNAGLCGELDLTRITNYGKILPYFRSQPDLSLNGKQVAIPFTWGAYPMIYRPDLVDECPTSWLDVLRPEFKGRVIMVGSHWGNIPAWAPVITGNEDPWRLSANEIADTIDFLIKIKKEHAVAVVTDYSEMVDIMGRGDAVVSTLGWEPQVQWAAARGINLEMTVPKEGTSGYMDVYMIPTSAPNYDLAHILIDNALSTSAQVSMAKELGQAVVNEESVVCLPMSLRTRYAYDNPGGKVRFTRSPLAGDRGMLATLDLIRKEWERFESA